MPAQAAKPIAEILREIVEQLRHPPGARILKIGSDVPKAAQGCRAGVGGGHSGFYVQLCFRFDVSGDLGLQLPLATPGKHSLFPLFRQRSEHAGDGIGKARPLGCLKIKLLAAVRREAIEARFAIVFRQAVRSGDPTTLQQALKRGIQRAMADLQHIFRHVLDGMPVEVAEEQASQYQQVQGSLQEIDASGIGHRMRICLL